MNLTEDDLRAVLREAGDEIAADRLRPLDLQSQQSRLATRGRAARWRRGRWLPGLAAAAAVTAVAIAATIIAAGTGGHRGGSSTPSAVTPSVEAHAGGVPPYYVAIMSGQSGLVTTVRDTKSGAVLATVPPPRGYWFVTAAPGATGDSFVLEANQHGGPSGLYLLQFNPADRTTSLARLPIPASLSTEGFAISPSGTELAVASVTNAGERSSLQIYTLSGKLVRQWQSPGSICLSAGLPCLSWSSSGYLAFAWSNNGTNVAEEGIRLIPQTASGASLLDASRLVIPLTTVSYADFVLSGDGARIEAGVLVHPRHGTFYSVFEEFSAITGKLIARYWPARPGVVGTGTAYGSNWTGSQLLVRAQFPQTSRNPRWLFGILTQGRFTPLPTPAGSWVSFAF